MPMTRIGFLVVAFHGPVYGAALRVGQAAHGAQVYQPKTGPRVRLTALSRLMTVGNADDRSRAGLSAQKRAERPSPISEARNARYPARAALARPEPSPSAACSNSRASRGQFSKCPSWLNTAVSTSPYVRAPGGWAEGAASGARRTRDRTCSTRAATDPLPASAQRFGPVASHTDSNFRSTRSLSRTLLAAAAAVPLTNGTGSTTPSMTIARTRRGNMLA